MNGLKTLMANAEKKYGKGIIHYQDNYPNLNIETLSSHSLTLDLALGGGYRKGGIIEIFGQEGTGKTTLTLHAIAEEQKKGGVCMFVDMEHALDLPYAELLGVDISELLFVQPTHGEMALGIVEDAIKSKEVSLIVVDSVASLIPEAELNGEMGENKLGLQARLMSQAMRKLSPQAETNKVTVFFINQLREKIGISFGNPNVTTGGKALKFYSSQRLEVLKSTTIKDGTDSIGNLTKVKVIKNKIARPDQRAEFNIIYGIGIDRIGEVIDLAVNFGIMNKSGSWYSYEGNKLGQGANAVRDLLEDNIELYEELESKVKEKINA